MKSGRVLVCVNLNISSSRKNKKDGRNFNTYNYFLVSNSTKMHRRERSDDIYGRSVSLFEFLMIRVIIIKMKMRMKIKIIRKRR